LHLVGHLLTRKSYLERRNISLSNTRGQRVREREREREREMLSGSDLYSTNDDLLKLPQFSRQVTNPSQRRIFARKRILQVVFRK